MTMSDSSSSLVLLWTFFRKNFLNNMNNSECIEYLTSNELFEGIFDKFFLDSVLRCGLRGVSNFAPSLFLIRGDLDIRRLRVSFFTGPSVNYRCNNTAAELHNFIREAAAPTSFQLRWGFISYARYSISLFYFIPLFIL